MNDYQALIENIRGFLASNFQVKTEEVAGWAEQYARLCREANERLQHCGDCLRRRLRVEAIHAAEAAPNLLDMVAALDLPELQEWKEACFRLEMADPPRLMLDTAAFLNEAYAQEQPLDGLMAYHRLMALARAPLRNRLAVMRKLEAMDTTSAVLEEDIRTFERLRLEELRVAVPIVARSGDLEGVQRLQEELAENWRIAVPADLRRLVDDVAAKFHRSAVDAELRRLMPALTEAYNAMAVDEAGTLLRQLLDTAAQAQIAIPPDLQEQINPIHQWLFDQQARREEEGKFTEAADVLRGALDANAPTPRLELSYREVQRFNMDLDPNLETRYRKTLHDRAAAARHKRKMIIGGIVAVIVVVAVTVAILVYVSMRAGEVRDTLALIQQAAADIDSGSLDRARSMVKLVNEQHPRVSSDASIIRAMTDFTEAVKAEQKRQDQFQKSLKQAQASGMASPDEAALKAAEDAAKFPDEQKTVADLKAKIADFAQSKQGKVDKRFLDDARDLAGEIEKTLTLELLAAHPQDYATQAGRLADRIKQLDERTDVSSTLRQMQTRSLSETLRLKQAKYDDVKSEKSLLDDVKKATSSREQGAAISAYITKLPASPYAPDFRAAVELVPAERAVEKWGQFTRGWDGQLLPANYDAAKARVEELEKFVTENESSLLTKPINDYITYLNLGLRATAPDGPWKTKYHNLLLNPLVHDLAALNTSEGKRYYVLDDPKIKVHKANGATVSTTFEAVLTSDVSKKDTVTLHAPVVLNSPVPVPSPQAIYAKAAAEHLAVMDFAGWETAGTRVVGDLLASKEMSPVLKAILLKNALAINQPMMEWSGDIACKSVFDALAGENVEDVEWQNPANPPRPELLATLTQLMGQVPRAEDLDAGIHRRRDAVLAALPTGLVVNGILMREEANWKIYAHGDAAEGATAYAVGTGPTLVALAHYQSRKWVIDAVAAQSVPVGSLVFVGTAK